MNHNISMNGLLVVGLVILAVLVYQRKVEGMQKDVVNVNANGRGRLLQKTNEGYYDDTWKVKCDGDAGWGNTIELVNPDNKKQGYMFRQGDDLVTKRVYKTKEAAMHAYCSNPDRILRYP